MAIYRTGQASMDAQGYITGYDTKWREQLSLIRPGATIFFIDAPFQAAVISEVISDTQIRAITTGGAEIGRSNYIILLHDSITVDGLAQDVAETLRYYQSKETQIEEAIEFFKNLDLKTLQDLVNQIKGDAEKTAADRAATEQLKNDTQQIKDSAVAETNQIKSDTDAIKSQTQQIKDSAVNETEAIKQGAFGARDQAELARDAAGNHAVDANNAKAGAETARDEARQWAQQVQPENLLHKDQNLNDLANKDLAREALKVEAVNSVKGQAAGDYNSFRNPAWTYELRIANNGEWRVARNSDGSTSALSVGAGGTGAENVEGARINFRLQGFDTLSSESRVLNPQNVSQYIFMNSIGGWGAYDSENVRAIPLSLGNGGTGGTDQNSARHNLGLSINHSPVFAGIDLQGLNGTTSGIMVLRNRDAGGAQVSYSRIYHEIQAGVARTTIQTTREGGGTNYFQIDETGLVNNVRAIRCSPSNVGGEGFTVGVVPGGGFAAWRDRPAGMIVEHPSDDVAVNVLKSVRWGGDWVMGIDAARYGAGGCEVHLNVRGTTYTFNDAGYASAVQWVNTSDIRLKANLKEIESAKEKVKSIKGYTYFKRNNLDEDEHSFYSEEAGVIAQDVQSVLPEAVYKISDSEYLGVSYGGVTALLVNAFNEMSDQIDKQQEEIETLKSEIADLKAAFEALLNKPTTLES
ncbi:tail fiber protein [Escherichia phage vB_EcoS_W011D]|uniref:Tail fiber protein n=1 Tax=Escherichia phage vB_EcoS_W011D TaxID=2575323 RepID=A0A4Y5NVJ6_9CAUD|nr:tail fiber protein [Escherichia phage vB_EcoS_W011D]QCW18510.1 tail fiber protein [Escherichia phage vB_EcoS_W011D]